MINCLTYILQLNVYDSITFVNNISGLRSLTMFEITWLATYRVKNNYRS